MADKTILVTGGAGYVGSHACKALAAAGYLPVTYDNLYRGHRRLVKWGPLEVGDIADSAHLAATIRRYAPSAVMHFAALALVGESMAEPDKYFRTNVGGTASLLAAMAETGVNRLVVSGTCTAYGVPAAMPIVETTPLAPINPYGQSKMEMERIIADAAPRQGLSSVVLRYFNAAGADPGGDTGEDHDPETHLIPNILRAASGKGPVRIFGEDYPTPDGTCIRDFVHVSDIAAGHVAALGYLEANAGKHVFNLGNGNGFSVREVIAAARRITEKEIPALSAPRRPGDPAVLIADTTRAKAALKWVPRRSTLDEQVTDAWNWHRKNS